MSDDLTWRQLNTEPEPSYRNVRRATITLFLAAIVLALLGVLMNQQYAAGYTNGNHDGLSAGYRDGVPQGRVVANVELLQWEHDHKCEVDSQGYVRLKIVPGKTTGQYEYQCAGGSK